MPERNHFNTKKAVRELLSGKPPEEVYAKVLRGKRMSELDIYDFARSHLDFPNNTDPRKAIVNTYFTALSIDAGILLGQVTVPGDGFPFRLADASERDMVDRYLEPLFISTYGVLTMNISSLAHPRVQKPHTELVHSKLNRWANPAIGEIVPLLSRVLSGTGTLLKTNGPDYPALLRDVAIASTGEVPTYDQLLDLMVSSAAVLSLPAAKDVAYINSVRSAVGSVDGWEDRLVYRRDRFSFDASGSVPKVVIGPASRVLIERDWIGKKAAKAEPETPGTDGILSYILRLLGKEKVKPSTIITGCPAMHGGLIDSALDLYVRSVRTRALPESPQS